MRNQAGGQVLRHRAGLLLIAGLILLPLLPVVLWAVAGVWPPGEVLPTELTGRGLGLVVDDRVGAALGTSLLVATLVATMACLVGLPAGRALGLYDFRGRRAVQFLLLTPLLVPPLAVTLGLQVSFIRLGLSGTVVGVALAQLLLTVPYAALLLGAAYRTVGDEHERQARVLGAKAWQAVVLVSLPQLRAALLTTWLLTFLVSWSEYVLTLLIGTGRVTTLPLLLFSAIESSDRTAAAALGLLVVLPPVLLVLAAAGTLGRDATSRVGLARA